MCPFEVGAIYKVIRSFSSLRGNFDAGHLLKFEFDTWSQYDGITGYKFENLSTRATQMWDVADSESIDHWQDLFERIQKVVVDGDARG